MRSALFLIIAPAINIIGGETSTELFRRINAEFGIEVVFTIHPVSACVVCQVCQWG